MYTSSCNEAIQSLMLLGNFCHGYVESDGILDVDLAVMDRASELSDALFRFVVVWSRFC